MCSISCDWTRRLTTKTTTNTGTDTKNHCKVDFGIQCDCVGWTNSTPDSLNYIRSQPIFWHYCYSSVSDKTCSWVNLWTGTSTNPKFYENKHFTANELSAPRSLEHNFEDVVTVVKLSYISVFINIWSLWGEYKPNYIAVVFQAPEDPHHPMKKHQGKTERKSVWKQNIFTTKKYPNQ